MSSISLAEYKKLYGNGRKTIAKSKGQPSVVKVVSKGEAFFAGNTA